MRVRGCLSTDDIFQLPGTAAFPKPPFFSICVLNFFHKIEMISGLFSQCPMYCRLVQVGNYDGM